MGSWTDKIKGKIKEIGGVATNDRSLEAEGKKDQVKGDIKEGIEDVKRDIRDAVNPDRNRV